MHWQSTYMLSVKRLAPHLTGLVCKRVISFRSEPLPETVWPWLSPWVREACRLSMRSDDHPPLLIGIQIPHSGIQSADQSRAAWLVAGFLVDTCSAECAQEFPAA